MAFLIVLISSVCSIGISLFVGEGELSAKVLSQLFFDYIVQIFHVPISAILNRDIFFTA